MQENNNLRTGDVVHYKFKGWRRFLKGLNPTRSGIFVSIHNVDFVATIIDGKVVLINWFTFERDFSYISSSPIWKTNPAKDVMRKIGWTSYSNSDQFVGEILGAKDFESFKKGSVLTYCIQKEWLSV